MGPSRGPDDDDDDLVTGVTLAIFLGGALMNSDVGLFLSLLLIRLG